MNLRSGVHNQMNLIAGDVEHGECFYSQHELDEFLTRLDKMKELSIAYFNENRIHDVKVFRVNETDAVAAETLEEAKEWYMKKHNLSEDDAFYDYGAYEVALTHEIWQDESRTKKEVLKDIILEFWDGTPFVAFTTGY